MTVQPLSGRLLLHRIVRYGGLVILVVAVAAAILAANRDSHVHWLRKATTAQLLEEAKSNSEDEELLLVLDNHLAEDQKYQQAYELTAGLVKKFPDSARCWDHYAKDAAQISHVLEALNGYQQELKLDPMAAPARATVGSIYLHAGLISDGLNEINAAQSIEAKVPVNVIEWAQALMKKGRFDEAWEHLVRSINVDPTQDKIWEPFIQVAIKLHRCDEAEALLTRRIGLSPMYNLPDARAAFVHLLLAQSHTALILDEARYVATLGAHSTDAPSQIQLAEVLIVEKDLKGARAVLENGLKMDASEGVKVKNPDCLRMLAEIADKQDKPADARKFRSQLPPVTPDPPQLIGLREAAAAAPRDVRTQLAYANALEQATQYSAAAEVWAGMLETNKSDQDAARAEARCRDEALRKLDASARAEYAAKQAEDAKSRNNLPF